MEGPGFEVASYVMTTFPTIIYNTLSGLSARDLNKCARVCKPWSDAVRSIKRKRKTASWIVDLFGEEDGEQPTDRIKSYIQALYTEPALFFMFCQTDIVDDPVRVQSANQGRRRRSAAKYERQEVGDFVTSLLPRDCSFVGMSADGVVGCSRDLKQSFEMESEKSVSFLSLPKYDGVDVYVFTADAYTFSVRSDVTNIQRETIDVQFFSTIPPDKKVKAILFFSDESFTCPEIGYSLLSNYPETIVAGGYVDNLVRPVHCSYGEDCTPSMMFVAFCGDRLKTASILIREVVNTEEEAETQIKKLKACKLAEDKSFAFMFACVGRGRQHYDKECVESTVFRKHFPKTPLLGFFGNGEVGFNSLPDCSHTGAQPDKSKTSDEAGKQVPGRNPHPKLYHAYTTIICLFSVT